jgi:proline iminopeptidase
MRLKVDTLRDGTAVELYITVRGARDGIPVVYLHGGPGDAHSTAAGAVFDPRRYRVIQYDQRGCGKSTPRNHLEKNTTPHLLRDLELIRLKVNGGRRWVVAGGSWGTSLALCYAVQHPEHVLGLLLRGVYDFTPGHPEYKRFPDIARELTALVGTPAASRSFHAATLRELIRQPRLGRTRRRLVRLLNDDRPLYAASKPPRDKTPFKDLETMAILGAHYEANDFFQPFDLYERIDRLRDVPIIMVQGRSDYICPPAMAKRIKARLPHADLRLVAGGHALGDPPILAGVKKAAADLAEEMQKKEVNRN